MKAIVISDTHNRHNKLDFSKYLDCDTIIHCGDYGSVYGDHNKYFKDFINWFASLPFKNKIFISGNHDPYMIINKDEGYELINKLGLIYLENTNIIIDGIKIHGSPNTIFHFNHNYENTENELSQIYDLIDEDTDILITHSPAYKILDYVRGCHVGSSSLRNRINELKQLKYHCFGHVHESSGIKSFNDKIFINAAVNMKINEFKVLNID